VGGTAGNPGKQRTRKREGGTVVEFSLFGCPTAKKEKTETFSQNGCVPEREMGGEGRRIWGATSGCKRKGEALRFQVIAENLVGSKVLISRSVEKSIEDGEGENCSTLTSTLRK